MYQWTWENGCVTYAMGYNADERAQMEKKMGKLVRCVKAI